MLLALKSGIIQHSLYTFIASFSLYTVHIHTTFMQPLSYSLHLAIDYHTRTMEPTSSSTFIFVKQSPQPSPLLISAPHQLITTRSLPPSHLEPQAFGRVNLAVHEPEPVALEVVEVNPIFLPHKPHTCRKEWGKWSGCCQCFERGDLFHGIIGRNQKSSNLPNEKQYQSL